MTPRILCIGTDARAIACRELLAAHPRTHTLGVRTILILPIPSTRDGVHISTMDIPLSTLPCADTLLLGYGLPPALCAQVRSCGGRYIDASLDERFTEDNAYLTAVATLPYLQGVSTLSPHDKTVGILGYGRIGRQLCLLLRALGTRVCVYTTRASVRQSLSESGIDSVDSSQPPLSFRGVDILVNTAPARGVIDHRSTELPPCILELASGDNIDEDIPHTRLPSLPARHFPKSAGAAYARCLLRATSAVRP